MNSLLSHFLRLQQGCPHLAALLLCLLKSSVIVGLMLLLAHAFGHRSALARNRAWRGAIIGLLGLACWEIVPASLSSLHPTWRVRRVVPGSETAPGSAAADPGFVPARANANPAPPGNRDFPASGPARTGTSASSAPLASRGSRDIASATVLRRLDDQAARIWCAGSLLFLLWYASRNFAGTWWLGRSARPVGVLLQAAVQETAAAMGVRQSCALATCPGLDTPLLVGWFRPTIFLPKEGRAWTPAKLRTVFIHELSHWQRRDGWWQAVGALTACVWWWNPLARWAVGRLKLEAELAADDAVVLRQHDAAAYAQTLVEMAAVVSGQACRAGIAMVGRSPLETRVRSLLRDNPWRGRQGGLSATVTVALVGLFLAAGGLYVRSADLPSPTPAAKVSPPGQEPPATDGPVKAAQPSTRTVSGRVLTPENRSASGAAVTLLLFDGGGWHARYAQADPQGAFRFEQVLAAAGERRVFQVLAQKPGHGLGWIADDGSTDHLEVHLNRPSQLAVRVADADGKPIAGLKLRVRMLLWSGVPGPLGEVPELADNRLSAETDQNGRGVFADLPAGAQVMLAHPDPRYAQFGFGSWVILGDGSQVDAGTLTLGAAATISGTLRYAGPEARSAAGVNVHAQPRGSGGAGNADTWTDDQGHFTFRQMAAASYDLRCYLDQDLQRQWASPPRESTVAAGQTTVDQDLTLTYGALITGRITAADTGKGVADIPVGTEPRPETSAGGNVFGESGPDGSYSLRVVPGKQHVYIATSDLKGYTLPDNHAADVEVKEGDTINLDFALPPTAAADFVSGRVVDDHDQPVAGAEVYVCLPGEWLFVPPQKADAQGNFRLRVPEIRAWEGRSKPVGPVGVRLFGRTETGWVTAQGLDARGGAQNVVLRLADHALAQVSGQVSDAGGHAMENVPVRAYVRLGDLPGCNRVVRTDAQGGFTFDGLWPGLEYSFHTEGEGYTREGVGQVTLTPGEKRRLAGWQLAEARLSIIGKVVDASGKPVAGATLHPQAQRVQDQGTTSDANGDFRLDGLAEEWMWLSVNYNLPTATMVRVKAGDRQVLVELPGPGAGDGGEDNRSEHFEAMIGKPAPAVQPGLWLKATPIPAEQWRGKVVMVNFWAVTCGPCIGALTEEQKFWEGNQGRDLVMVGVHNTGPALEVREFLQKQGLKITFPLAMDARHGATAAAYGVVALPAYAVIDQDGNMVYLGHEWEQAQRKAADLLEKRSPVP